MLRIRKTAFLKLRNIRKLDTLFILCVMYVVDLLLMTRGGPTFLLAGQIQKVRSALGRKKNDYRNLCLLVHLNPYVFIQNWVK